MLARGSQQARGLYRCFSDSSATSKAVTMPKPSGLQQSIPQASNRYVLWSRRQRPRADAMKGPRFQSINFAAQPCPTAAIELLKQSPIQMEHSRTVSCSGGDRVLGHPQVFINLVR